MTNQPTREETPLSENPFEICQSVRGVIEMLRILSWDNAFEADRGYRQAEARIAELSPRTVDEVGRERAREVTYDWWLNTTGMSRANADQLVDRIIDALGWTTAEPEIDPDADLKLKPGEVAPDWSKLLRSGVHPIPAPASPAVELDVDTLERICAVLNCHENTRAAMDKMPMFGDMPDITIPGALPMRITTNPFGVSVLRIGGTNE